MAADRDRWLLPRLARIVAVEGCPRNSRQCADLVDELRRRCCELVGLVVIDIPDDVVHKRVANRRLCSVCGKPENDLSDVFESSQEPTGGGKPVLRARKNRLDALPRDLADSTAADEADDLPAAGVSIPPATNRSSCARRAKPGSERPERASFCG